MANLLIVDDEPGMRQLLVHVFGRGAGHNVRSAENGAKALELGGRVLERRREHLGHHAGQPRTEHREPRTTTTLSLRRGEGG